MRSLILLGAVFLSLASTTEPRHSSTSPSYGGNNPNYPAATNGGGSSSNLQYYCFTLQTTQTTTSECAAGQPGCELLRQGFATDGMQTSACVAWSPVACFQLGGDPSPQNEMCAANKDDCEVWRSVDKQKNGTTGAECTTKQ
jgi:hypothetical protein